MKIKKESIPINKLTLIFLISLLVGSFLVSGIYGLKIVAMLLFFSIPFYLILDLFSFSLEEKIIFALFISLAFFSLLTYWINQIIPSYRYSMALSYCLLIIIYFIIRYIKKGDKN